MTKRNAILAAMGAVMGLMSNRAKSEPSGIAATSSTSITVLPQTVIFSFDTFDKFTFTSKGESVTLTGAEIFEALRR